MLDLKKLSDIIEYLELIPGYNDCILNKTCYRIGEFWSLTYDFEKFRKKLNANWDENEVLNYIYKNYNYKDNFFVKIIENPKREKIAEYDNKMLFCDGLDEALIGVRFGFDENKNIAVYDYYRCIDSILAESDGEMEECDAIEHMEYNVTGAYVGEYTPCFLTNIDE